MPKLKSRNLDNEGFEYQLSHSALKTLNNVKSRNSKSTNSRVSRNLLNIAGNFIFHNHSAIAYLNDADMLNIQDSYRANTNTINVIRDSHINSTFEHSLHHQGIHSSSQNLHAFNALQNTISYTNDLSSRSKFGFANVFRCRQIPEEKVFA